MRHPAGQWSQGLHLLSLGHLGIDLPLALMVFGAFVGYLMDKTICACNRWLSGWKYAS